MSKARQKPPIKRLMEAMEECARLRGKARWTNGYRCGNAASKDVLRPQERDDYVRYERSVTAFRRLAGKLLREAKNGRKV